MEHRRIFLEGITLDELLEEITEAVRKGLAPPVKPKSERVISQRQASRELGINEKTLKTRMIRHEITYMTDETIEFLREKYKKKDKPS